MKVSDLSANTAIFRGRVRYAEPKVSWFFRSLYNEFFARSSEEPLRDVRFEVLEDLVGTQGKTFEIKTGWGRCCDCTIDFQQGKEYFVVAHFHQGAWGTSVCSGTTLASYAREDIEALRAWKGGREQPRSIYGRVRESTEGGFKAVPLALITANAGDEKHEVLTDATGYFRLVDLGPKVYSLSSDRPNIDFWRNKEIDLVGNRCAEVYGYVEQPKSP